MSTIEREKQALRDAFTYRSLRRDLDLVFEDLNRAMFAEANGAGRPLYPVASEFVLDCYYERGALEPLVKSYSGQPFRTASRFDRLLGHLQQAQRGDLIERFWTSLARLTRAEFFYQRPRRGHGDHARAEEYKAYALEAYAQGIDWMTRLGRTEAARRLTEERDALDDERLSSLPPPSDRRRIDERGFWAVIAEARSRAPTTTERVAALGESLQAFDAARIKQFAARFASAMRKLYHWNVWALAYAARGGCSDTAFEAFRSWLILQGDPAPLALAIKDPARAAWRVPADPDLPDDGHCQSTIEEAYLLRQGSALEFPPIDLDEPRGKAWSEAAFATTHPQLVERYAPRRGPE